MAQIVDLIGREAVSAPYPPPCGAVEANDLPPHLLARVRVEPRVRYVPQHPLEFRGRKAAGAGANGLDQAVDRAALVFGSRPVHDPPALRPATA